MKTFVIKEQGGNFVSEQSFKKFSKNGKQWLYSEFTGKCPAWRTYPKHYASKIKAELQSIAKKLKLNKVFEIVEIDDSTIPKGEYVDLVIQV